MSSMSMKPPPLKPLIPVILTRLIPGPPVTCHPSQFHVQLAGMAPRVVWMRLLPLSKNSNVASATPEFVPNMPPKRFAGTSKTYSAGPPADAQSSPPELGKMVHMNPQPEVMCMFCEAPLKSHRSAVLLNM